MAEDRPGLVVFSLEEKRWATPGRRDYGSARSGDDDMTLGWQNCGLILLLYGERNDVVTLESPCGTFLKGCGCLESSPNGIDDDPLADIGCNICYHLLVQELYSDPSHEGKRSWTWR
ncbi:hypothetical protein ACLOJK_011870 [Asimina triloba]